MRRLDLRVGFMMSWLTSKPALTPRDRRQFSKGLPRKELRAMSLDTDLRNAYYCGVTFSPPAGSGSPRGAALPGRVFF
jgi:hypothetical protein